MACACACVRSTCRVFVLSTCSLSAFLSLEMINYMLTNDMSPSNLIRSDQCTLAPRIPAIHLSWVVFTTPTLEIPSESRKLKCFIGHPIPPGRHTAILEPTQETRMQHVQVRVFRQSLRLREDIFEILSHVNVSPSQQFLTHPGG